MSFIYQKFNPCAELSKYIDCYYDFNDNGLFKGVSVNVLDNSSTEMIIQLGDKIEFYNQDKDIHTRCKISLSGQYIDKITTTPTGHTHILSANFKPGGMYAIFGIPQYFFESNNVSLSDIDPLGSEWLWEELMELGNTNSRIRRLEEYLKNLLHKQKNPVVEMEYAASLIRKHGGCVSIHKLADILKISTRTFNRRFRMQVGIVPKQYAEIIRLNRVCEDLLSSEKTDLLTLAIAHGYYDPSHLINTFKRYLHITPAGFADNKLRNGDYNGKITIVDHSEIRASITFRT